MEQWTSEIWTAVIVAFLVGTSVGYFVVRTTNSNVQKQHKLEAELKAATAKIDAQKEQLEQHFSTSANLLATLAEDYKKLYTHLAKGSQQMLPETAKVEFFENPELKAPAQSQEHQPKDYSEGSSGLLKS